MTDERFMTPSPFLSKFQPNSQLLSSSAAGYPQYDDDGGDPKSGYNGGEKLAQVC